MKLTTVVIAAAALAGAAGAASTASASATIFEEYQFTAESGAVDGTYYSITNNGPTGFTDVTIAGTDLGSLAAGSSTSFVGVGDPSITPQAVVTILVGGTTYTSTWHDVLGDEDANTSPVALGTAVPEPATWAMMLAGFAGLGGALRMRRKAPIAV